MDDDPTEYADAPFRLVPCNICGRKFKEDRFGKHYDVCKKGTQTQAKRKVFDSSKQRAEGTEIATVKPSRTTVRQQQASRIPAKKSGWREKHEEFIRTIRHAKQITEAEQNGGPLPPPPPPAANPDYVTCEYCNRRFNEHAAERHIPFCREQAARIPKNKPGIETAKLKQSIRTKYQPPPPKVKNGGSSGYNDLNSQRSGGSSRTQPTGSGYGRQQNGYNPSRYSSGDRRDGNPASQGSMIPNGKSLRTGKSQQQYLAYREEHLRDSPGSHQPRGGIGGGSGGNTRTRSGSGSRAMERSPSVDSLNNHYSSAGHVTNKRFGYNSGKPPLKQNPSHLDSLPSGDQRNGSAGPSKFCHECGSKHPIPSARFCCMCGVRRMTVAN